MRFSVFQVTRQGGRKKNEDRMGYCYTSDSVLLMLADGMGGHPEGDVAAALAMEAVAGQFHAMARPKLDDVTDFLAQALMAAHAQLLRYAADHKLNDTPRTTLVMAVIQSGQVCWTHCGDSRLYLVRAHQLLVRTQDHSLIEQRRSQFPGNAAAVPPDANRNVLFTCLGSPSRPVFSINNAMDLQQGDTLMLCSDGLWGSVPEQDIVDELSQNPVETAVPDLVDKALQQAGNRSDNVTCLALTWLTPAPSITTNPDSP